MWMNRTPEKHPEIAKEVPIMRNKRIAALLMALVLMLTALPMAGLAEGTDKVKLYYYGWTDEESYMTALINLFNEQNADIEVIPSFVNHDDHNQKVVVMVSGNADNFDLVSVDSLANVINLSNLGGLLPLKERIDASGIDMSAYGPIIKETVYNDEYYGLPYRSSLYSLYYNKDLFDKKGLPYPEKITWDEYLELSRQLTYEENGVQFWGGFIPDWLSCPLAVYQKNSNLLDDDMTALTDWMTILNTAINVDKSHMTFQQQTAESIDWLKFFCTGTTGMLLNGEWTISMFKDYVAQGIDVPNWDVTYLPCYDTNGDVVSAGGLSTFIAVGANTKYPEEAFRFVQFMASEEASVYLASQGVLPAYSSDAVKASFAEAAGVAGASTLLSTTISLEAPNVSGYSALSAAYQEEKQLYITEQESLEEFTQNMIDRREEILSDY